jgi:hypothetical protein
MQLIVLFAQSAQQVQVLRAEIVAKNAITDELLQFVVLPRFRDVLTDAAGVDRAKRVMGPVVLEKCSVKWKDE